MATRETLAWICDAGGCLREAYGKAPKGWHRGSVFITVRGLTEHEKWAACCAEHIKAAVLTVEEELELSV